MVIILNRLRIKGRCNICNKSKHMNLLQKLYKENSLYFLEFEINLCNKCLHHNFNKKDFSNTTILFQNFYKLMKKRKRDDFKK